MASESNHITLSLAVLLLIIITWTSHGNPASHSKEKVGAEINVNELDTINRCVVRDDISLLVLPQTDLILLDTNTNETSPYLFIRIYPDRRCGGFCRYFIVP